MKKFLILIYVVLTGGVNGRRVTSAAGTDDNDLFAHNSIYVRCHGKGPVPVLRVDFALCGDNAAAYNPAVAGRVPVVAEKNCLPACIPGDGLQYSGPVCGKIAQSRPFQGQAARQAQRRFSE